MILPEEYKVSIHVPVSHSIVSIIDKNFFFSALQEAVFELAPYLCER